MIQHHRQPLRTLPGILLCLTLAGIFLPLLGEKGLAFRDTAHFYSPSFRWQADQWHNGSIPLWNDQEGLGTDVAGDGSSSLYYPGKLLLVLAPLPWTSRLNLYILAHMLLAAWGSYRLARSWKLRQHAALLAATGYSLAGPLLSLHANLPFLVSAAWLPWSLQALDQLLRRGQRSSAIPLALVLALMVLGGDPQAVYHVGLAGGLYLLVLPRQAPALRRREGMLLLCGTALLAGMLSAVQLLPLLESSRQSTRAGGDSARSIYELGSGGPSPGQQLQGLLGNQGNALQHDPYEFSLSPWRLTELAWPNIHGRLYPQNQRWLRALGGERRIWTPTLYMGLLVMVLAWCGWSLRTGDPQRRWLSWLLLLSGVASLGLYGIGWGLRQAGLVEGSATDPAGGLYWWLVVFLPGYAKFRFPAKLWIFFTLSGSLLAGWQMQKLLDGVRHGPARCLRGLAGLGLGGLILLLLLRPWILELLAAGQSDYLLGPLQADAAYNGILLALAHGTLLALLLLVMIAKLRPATLGPLLVSLTILELAIANSWLVSRAPASHWSTPSPVETMLFQPSTDASNQSPERMFRAQWRRWYPRHWISEPSGNRLAEAVEWDRQTLLPRYQLLTPLGTLESSQSLKDRTLATLLEVGRRHGTRRPDGLAEPDAQLLRMLGVHWIAGPAGWQPGVPAQTVKLPLEAVLPANYSLWQISSPQPFAQLVNVVRQAGPIATRLADLDRQIEEELYPGGQLVDLRRRVILHGAKLQGQAPGPGNSPAARRVQLTHFEPTRRELTVKLSRPGYLVLNQAYAPGWVAWSRTSPGEQWQAVPIERANFVASALPLPAGEHQLLIRYQPASFRLGMLLGLAGFTLVLLLAAPIRWRKGQLQEGPSPGG